MIVHPGEYHDATSTVPVPQCRQTLELVQRGLLMPPLPIQAALRKRRSASVVHLPIRREFPDTEAA